MKYSIKMRASETGPEGPRHISGAERIVSEEQIAPYMVKMTERAQNHAKGKADFINIKIEEVKEQDILYIPALEVKTVLTEDEQSGIHKMISILQEMQVAHAERIVRMLQDMENFRGAILLDVDTLKHLEPDQTKGIRATYMDSDNGEMQVKSSKNHYYEAIVLASKVANAPNIIGEICISDDPDYTTGYVAGRSIGYVRITNLKPVGSEKGGRIFLYRGEKSQVQKTIEYLRKQCVIVKHIKEIQNQDLCDTETARKTKQNWFEEELHKMKEKNLYRSLKCIRSEQSAHVRYLDRDMLMLASNSYLDMISDNRVKEYAKDVLEEFGLGSGGSRLTTGNTVIHEQLEKKIAAFKETEAALVFNSGYVANIAVISALCSKEDVIFSDELNHASIIDGCRLSGAKIVVYKHNDMEDLEKKAKGFYGRKGLIVSDAVFSMDGDIVNLPKLMEIADRYGFFSMIDEAHATGVIGKTGRGTTEHYNLKRKPDVLMGTFSKALGSEGGFVCGSKVLIEFLKNRARGFIFSTSLSPVTMAASYKAIELLEKEPKRVLRLQENVVYFCKCLQEEGILVSSETAIIPIFIGDEKKAVQISDQLFEKGYFVSAIRYPTVAKDSARFRIALMSSHHHQELKEAAQTIGILLKETYQDENRKEKNQDE